MNTICGKLLGQDNVRPCTLPVGHAGLHASPPFYTEAELQERIAANVAAFKERWYDRFAQPMQALLSMAGNLKEQKQADSEDWAVIERGLDRLGKLFREMLANSSALAAHDEQVSRKAMPENHGSWVKLLLGRDELPLPPITVEGVVKEHDERLLAHRDREWAIACAKQDIAVLTNKDQISVDVSGLLEPFRKLEQEWREIDKRYNDADQILACAHELAALLPKEER